MIATIRLLFLVPAFALIVAAAGSLATHYRRPTNLCRAGMAICFAPSLVLLGLFYTLALHMHQSLGAWPHSIGERGFPPGLLVHASAASNYFAALLLATLFAGPPAFVVGLLVRSWHRCTIYLSLHVLSFAVCAGLMLLAPAPFLTWWRD